MTTSDVTFDLRMLYENMPDIYQCLNVDCLSHFCNILRTPIQGRLILLDQA